MKKLKFYDWLQEVEVLFLPRFVVAAQEHGMKTILAIPGFKA